MRVLLTAILALSFSTAAFSAETNTNANQPGATFAPALPATAQPDSMKVIPGSGGVSTSYIIKNAPLSDDYVMGDAKAPLILIEYASMTCPHCAHFANGVLPELEKKYVKTGKMRYILRQFPIDEVALKVAMLLECVGDQNSDKYYKFASVFFDSQGRWANERYLEHLETISMVGGLSRQQFAGCINNTDREMRILKQKKLAVEEVKLPATPYIFIGGEVYAGERTVEAMSAFIDAKLAQKK